MLGELLKIKIKFENSTCCLGDIFLFLVYVCPKWHLRNLDHPSCCMQLILTQAMILTILWLDICEMTRRQDNSDKLGQKKLLDTLKSQSCSNNALDNSK